MLQTHRPRRFLLCDTTVIWVILFTGAPDPRTQAIYYFVCAIAVLLIAFDAYFLLPLTVSLFRLGKSQVL